MPRLAGNQIPFGGTRHGFVYVSIIKGGLLLLYTPTQKQVLFLQMKFDFQLTLAYCNLIYNLEAVPAHLKTFMGLVLVHFQKYWLLKYHRFKPNSNLNSEND
jgi:hypothetical protein